MLTKPPYGKNEWIDPDDGPALTDEFFDRAEIRIGDKVIRPGRPPLPSPKVQTTLRLDQDVVAYFRAEGPGWQSRINAALREAISPKTAVG
jgi:uncharacterized protein (DUF4415 family)